MAQVSHSPLRSSARRRSQRVLMQVGILIRGTDTHERPFEEQTETLAINAHGALILLENKVISGATVLMRHKRTEEEQECHVVFLGPLRSGRAEVGLEFSVPRPLFWRVAFPPEDWTPRHPDARTLAGPRSKYTK